MPRIRCVDFESTGMDPDAEVIEVAYCDLVPDSTGEWEVERPVSWLCEVRNNRPDARATHHIGRQDTRGMPPFDPARLSTATLSLDVALYAFHYAAFDTKFWTPPAKHICTWKAALRTWPDAPSHSNGALRYWLEDQDLIHVDEATAWPPHRAGPDSYITAHILRALLDHHSARQMEAWTREPALLPRCPIGEKWRGKPWAEVEGGFLYWVVGKDDIDADTRWCAQRELDRRLHIDPPAEVV